MGEQHNTSGAPHFSHDHYDAGNNYMFPAENNHMADHTFEPDSNATYTPKSTEFALNTENSRAHPKPSEASSDFKEPAPTYPTFPHFPENRTNPAHSENPASQTAFIDKSPNAQYSTETFPRVDLPINLETHPGTFPSDSRSGIHHNPANDQFGKPSDPRYAPTSAVRNNRFAQPPLSPYQSTANKQGKQLSPNTNNRWYPPNTFGVNPANFSASRPYSPLPASRSLPPSYVNSPQNNASDTSYPPAASPTYLPPYQSHDPPVGDQNLYQAPNSARYLPGDSFAPANAPDQVKATPITHTGSANHPTDWSKSYPSAHQNGNYSVNGQVTSPKNHKITRNFHKDLSSTNLNERAFDARFINQELEDKTSRSYSKIFAFLVIIGGICVSTAMWVPWLHGKIANNTYSNRGVSWHLTNELTGVYGLYFIPWTIFVLGIVTIIIGIVWQYQGRAKFWATIIFILSLILVGLSIAGLINPLDIYSDFRYKSQALKPDFGVYLALVGSAFILLGSVFGFILGRDKAKN